MRLQRACGCVCVFVRICGCMCASGCVRACVRARAMLRSCVGSLPTRPASPPTWLPNHFLTNDHDHHPQPHPHTGPPPPSVPCPLSRYITAIQLTSQHLLRYLAVAVVVNKRRRNVVKDLIRVIQQVGVAAYLCK